MSSINIGASQIGGWNIGASQFVSAGWYLDDGNYIDFSSVATIEGEVEFTSDFSMIYNPFADLQQLEIKVNFELKVIAAVALDLMQLVPEKFHGKLEDNWFRDYISEMDLQVGSWLTYVRDIIKLENPYTVGSMKYLRHLGYIIGVNFPSEDETTELEMRKTLAQATDWYKVKGTYQSIQVLALIYQLSINVYDMYTNDYVNFYLTDWFVGDEDENPSGFDATYYKSPHFGIEVLLNKVYESGSESYLWKSIYLTNFIERMEETRPVHTVPHYLIFLNPKTDEFGHVIEVDGEIKARTMGDWEVSTKYFDMVGSPDNWFFDEGDHFDQSADGFIKSITTWVLGTGNYPCLLCGEPGESAAICHTDVETPVLTGSIDPDDIIITSEKITFEFIVPKATVQDDISELGLYVPGSPDRIMILSCFPKIDKSDDVELKIQVEVYKSDLS